MTAEKENKHVLRDYRGEEIIKVLKNDDDKIS